VDVLSLQNHSKHKRIWNVIVYRFLHMSIIQKIVYFLQKFPDDKAIFFWKVSNLVFPKPPFYILHKVRTKYLLLNICLFICPTSISISV